MKCIITWDKDAEFWHGFSVIDRKWFSLGLVAIDWYNDIQTLGIYLWKLCIEISFPGNSISNNVN